MPDPRVQILPAPPFPGPTPVLADGEPRPGNRYRWLLFAIVLALGCTAGLAWDFMRPGVYRSTATLRFAPASDATAAAGQALGGGVALDAQVQELTGRPLLERLLARLPAGAPLVTTGAADRLAALHAMLSVEAQPESGLVYLHARGAARSFLPVLVNTWLDTFMASQAAATSAADKAGDKDTRKRIEDLDTAIAAKRAALASFQREHDIVSLQRDENATVARLKGLSLTRDKTNEVAISAESRLAALRAAVAAGKPVGKPREMRTLAALEAQAEKLEERMTEYHSVYTPAYIAIDPRIQAVQKQLTDLQRKLRNQRKEAQDAALSEAEQDVASARRAVADVDTQIAAAKRKAAAFSAAFAQSQAMNDELSQLRSDAAALKEKLVQARLARDRSTPAVQVLERASLPSSPIQPDYARDAGLVAAGSLLCALLCVWLLDFLTGRPRAARADGPASVHYSLVQMAAPDSNAAIGQPAPTARELSSGAPAGLLAGGTPELSSDDVARLLDSCDPPTRTLAMALLCGLSLDEAVALEWRDVDLDEGVLRVASKSGRRVALAPRLLQALAQLAASETAQSAGPVWRDPGGDALPARDLDALITCAAHDAGLSAARTVDAGVLRHTYIAHLARKGLRLSELERIVGYITPSERLAYGGLLAPGRERPVAEHDLVYPVLADMSIP